MIIREMSATPPMDAPIPAFAPVDNPELFDPADGVDGVVVAGEPPVLVGASVALGVYSHQHRTSTRQDSTYLNTREPLIINLCQLLKRKPLPLLRCRNIRAHRHQSITLNIEMPTRSIRRICQIKRPVFPRPNSPKHTIITQRRIRHIWHCIARCFGICGDLDVHIAFGTRVFGAEDVVRAVEGKELPLLPRFGRVGVLEEYRALSVVVEDCTCE
jgi:hypothetical protein